MPQPQNFYYAAIDLGSNSCRLLTFEQKGDKAYHIDAYSRITRLSEGVASTGLIREETQEKTLSILKHILKRLEGKFPLSIRCVATEVCRRARNAQSFLNRIFKETRLNFTIISEQEEAHLAFMGLTPLLDSSYPYGLAFDIGGASTEVILIKTATEGKPPHIVDWVSIPMGVVSVLETHHPENCTNYLKIIDFVYKSLSTFGVSHGLSKLIKEKKIQLIGASGTATTVASLHLGLRYYDRRRIDGHVITFGEIRNTIKKLQMMSLTERSLHPCIGPERADLVLGGTAIFEGLAKAWPVGCVTVADRGVRDGLIAEMINGSPLFQASVA